MSLGKAPVPQPLCTLKRAIWISVAFLMSANVFLSYSNHRIWALVKGKGHGFLRNRHQNFCIVFMSPTQAWINNHGLQPLNISLNYPGVNISIYLGTCQSIIFITLINTVKVKIKDFISSGTCLI